MPACTEVCGTWVLVCFACSRLRIVAASNPASQYTVCEEDSAARRENNQRRYVAAVSELLNEGYAKVTAILAYGLRDDIDVSIALTVNDKIVRCRTREFLFFRH